MTQEADWRESVAATESSFGKLNILVNNARSLGSRRHRGDHCRRVGPHHGDREVQRTQNYTGIEGINTQDRAVQESMGYIADRALERLGTTDRAIIAARRLLLQALETVERGEEPPGVAPTYDKLRAVERVLPAAAHWLGEMRGDLYQVPPSTDAVNAVPVGG